jgi:hypothetical protein
MVNLKRYPRGYLTSTLDALADSNDVEIADVACDSRIEDLYKSWSTRVSNTESWKFKKLVVARCAQLFGDFYHWLIIQSADNDNIYDLNFEFLKDTVQYIRTGVRSAQLQTWKELLLEYPEPQIGCASKVRSRELMLTDAREFENVIGKWCSYDGGFEDMLCTALVLFGSSKKPRETQI